MLEDATADGVEEHVDAIGGQLGQSQVDVVAMAASKPARSVLNEHFFAPPAIPLTLQPRVFAIRPAMDPVTPAHRVRGPGHQFMRQWGRTRR
ncbi:hypothetical protein [Nocardia gipuzkoensis]